MNSLTLGYILMTTAVIGFVIYGVSFKFSAFKGLNLKAVNVSMYMATTIAIAAAAKATGGFPLDWKFWTYGIAIGLTSYLFVICLRKACALGSTSVCWTILQMAIILPFISGAIVYHELPKWNHWLGLLCTAVGVALLGKDVKRQQQ